MSENVPHMSACSAAACSGAQFVPVVMENWPRRDYFSYYFNAKKCRYSITAQLDITEIMAARRGHRFFPVLLYVLMAAINGEGGAGEEREAAFGLAADNAPIAPQTDMPLPSADAKIWPGRDVSRTFRMAFDVQGNLGWWSFCNPLYTLFHKDDCSFSDVWSRWSPNFSSFYATVVEDIARYGNTAGLAARGKKPANFCSVSSLPWLSFTSFAQDTYAESRMLFPLLRAGRHYFQAGRTLLPLAVCVHHAVADGYHTAWLLGRMQRLADTASLWLC